MNLNGGHSGEGHIENRFVDTVEERVQFSSVAHSFLTFCDTRGLQHARTPYPSPNPGV